MGGGAAARRCPYSDLAGSAAAGPNACAVCRRDGVRAAAWPCAWRCDGCCVRLHVVHGRRVDRIISEQQVNEAESTLYSYIFIGDARCQQVSPIFHHTGHRSST
jgi:hypothetical protein